MTNGIIAISTIICLPELLLAVTGIGKTYPTFAVVNFENPKRTYRWKHFAPG